MKKLLLLLVPTALWAQTSYVVTCPNQAAGGATTNCPLVATTVGASLVASQFSITVTSGATSIPWNISTALTNKTVWTAQPNPIALLYGQNAAVIPNGATISNISFVMPQSGSVSVTVNSCYASDPAGGAISCTTNPTVVVGPLTSKCDVDGNGIIDQADVNAMRLQIQSAPPSANKNITHLQQVQNAANGLPCTLP